MIHVVYNLHWVPNIKEHFAFVNHKFSHFDEILIRFILDENHCHDAIIYISFSSASSVRNHIK